jgi:hypothetical protein
MIIESYADMKQTINYLIKHFILTKDNYDLSTISIIISCHVNKNNSITCGWTYKNELGKLQIFTVLNSDDIFNFTKNVYNEKIKEIMLLLKQYKIKQRKNELEKDFN